MYINKKDYTKLMDYMAFLSARLFDVQKSVDSLGRHMSTNNCTDHTMRVVFDMYHEQNKQLHNYLDIIEDKNDDRYYKQNRKIKDLETHLCNEIEKLTSTVKKNTSYAAVYNGGVQLDEIAGAIKDYYDSKECY